MEEKNINEVAIFAAMNKEMDYFLSETKNQSSSEDGECVTGELFGKKVYLVKTDIGSMNSVFNATKFLSHRKPDLVINIGCVGSHSLLGEYGDIIVVENFLGEGDFLSEKCESIPTDEIFRKKLVSCFDENVSVGDIASGDLWRNSEQIEKFVSEYGTLGEDMEGFPEAFCAKKFSVPFVSVKFVSNNELTGKPYEYGFFRACQQKIFRALEKFFA